MSRGSDSSNTLAEYMAKGWVLTAQRCPTPGCIVPLLRSPDRSVQFCAKCDGSAVARASAGSTSNPAAPTTSTTAQPPSPISSAHTPGSSQSTPPTTPPSRSPSLPALPDPSPLTLQRRAQSDLASQRIGERLLKGWAMLGEECPTETCWGVPLVRRPGRAKGGRGDGGECVICGWGSEVAGQAATSAAGPSGTSNPPVRPVHEEDIVRSFYASSAPIVPTPAEPPVLAQPPSLALPPLAAVAPRSPAPPSSSLSYTTSALIQTLSVLSERLVALSSSPITADPLSIKATVDAMGAVIDTLGKARALEAGRF